MRVILVLAALCGGCATANIKPFVMSNEAMMSRVAMEASFTSELKDFFKSADGKRVVVVNIENAQFTNDQNPEYILHDAFYGRLTNENVQVLLLDRDPDVLEVLAAERRGRSVVDSSDGGPTDTLTAEERRAKISGMISQLLDQISPQDVLVHHQVTGASKQRLNALPRGTVSLRKKRRAKKAALPIAHAGDPVVSPELVANELGPRKAALLRHLVSEYTKLFTVPNAKKKSQKLDLASADYLLAYRVYEFGPYNNKLSGGGYERTTYLKLHLRIVDMKTGGIIASDFMEHAHVDNLSAEQFAVLQNVRAKDADFRRPAGRSPKKSKALQPKSSPSAPSEARNCGLLNLWCAF